MRISKFYLIYTDTREYVSSVSLLGNISVSSESLKHGHKIAAKNADCVFERDLRSCCISNEPKVSLYGATAIGFAQAAQLVSTQP